MTEIPLIVTLNNQFTITITITDDLFMRCAFCVYVISGGSRGSTAGGGGVTKSARSAAGGGCGRGNPLPQVGVRGASPGKIFEKKDANGAF